MPWLDDAGNPVTDPIILKSLGDAPAAAPAPAPAPAGRWVDDSGKPVTDPLVLKSLGAPPEMSGAAPPLSRADEISAHIADRLRFTRDQGPKRIDDLARSVASGATFGLADEGAALSRSVLGGPDYSTALAQERQRDAAIPPEIKIPGEIAGSAMTGLGMGRAGLTLLRTANPTVLGMAGRGAAEGALYGAASGFGHGEGSSDRFTQAGIGAATGAVTGGALGAGAGAMARRGAEAAVPSTEALHDAASANYDAAHAAGVEVNPESVTAGVDKIASAARVHPRLHPDAAETVGYLQSLKDKPLSLQDLDEARQYVGDLLKSQRPGEQRIGGKLVNAFDDFLDGLKPEDVSAGDPAAAVDALKTARDLWSRFRKSELIDGLNEKALNAASGYENGLRNTFRSLANNPKEMARFTPEEQDAITRVVRGGPVENLTRLFGKLAPTGVVSGAVSASLGHALGGAAGSVVLPAIGAGARAAAGSMTGGNANAVSTLVRSGGAMPAATLPGRPGLIDALIAGSSDQALPIVTDGLARLLAGRR